MNESVLIDELQREWVLLMSSWRLACDSWRDSVRDEFHRDFWKPVEEEMPSVLQAITALDELLEDALRDTQQ